MFMVNHLNGFNAGGAAANVAPLSNSTSGTDLTTYSFTSMTLSAVGYNVAVVAGQGGSSTVSSVTIDGQAAAQVVAVTATNRVLALWVAPSSGNASGTVSVTFGAGQSRAGCAVFGLTGVGSSTASNTTTSNTGNPISASLNVPAGGSAIGATYSDGNVNFTWTNLTEYVDQSIEAGNVSMGSAYGNFASTQTGLSVSASLDTAPGNQLLVAASWGP